MKESAIVVSETADNIAYLSIICRYDDTDTSFYLLFDLDTHSKKGKPKNSTSCRYMMQVTQVDTSYRLKLRLEGSTFSEDGTNVGHTKPNSEWDDDNGWGTVALKHYLLHQSTTLVHTKNIDVSRWNPLFTIAQNEYDQSYMLKLSLVERQSDEHFTLSCEMLGISNTLVNNELRKYVISTHTLYFTLVGRRYYVQTQLNTAKAYTDGGRDVEDMIVSQRVEETRPADEILFSRKVLEYYLAHQSEFEVNTDT